MKRKKVVRKKKIMHNENNDFMHERKIKEGKR